MKWTKELPKESGFYWMKEESQDDSKAEPVQVELLIPFVYQLGNDVPLGLYDDDFDFVVFCHEKIVLKK